MDLIKAITLRHSIREFEKRSIPISTLKKLIKNATYAPSAGNSQPWIFYCISNKSKRNEISKLLKSTLKIFENDLKKKPKKLQKISNNFYQDLGGAQNLIFIFREKQKNEPNHTENSVTSSIACAAQNIMLSAQEYGLGTCWIGSFRAPNIEKKLKRILGTKNNEILICSLIIGYPKKGYNPLKRKKKKLKEIIKWI